MGRLLSCVMMVASLAGTAHAQARLSHVFPQLADGYAGDIIYNSMLWVTNPSATSSSCILSTHDIDIGRFAGNTSFTVPPWSSIFNITPGNLPLDIGYASLGCTSAVVASLTYLLSDNEIVRGAATVFSAPPVKYANIPMLLGVPGMRHGFAIANETDGLIAVTMYLTTNPADLTDRNVSGTVKNIYLFPNTHHVEFADEVFDLDADRSPSMAGPATIEFTSSSDFHIAGIMQVGEVFTTIVPATDAADGSSGATGGSSAGSSCVTAIESKIDGVFEGWDGDTAFTLTNGQIWRQASYAYTYHYAYRPDVLIYPSSSGGCVLRVDGASGSIRVTRIR